MATRASRTAEATAKESLAKLESKQWAAQRTLDRLGRTAELRKRLNEEELLLHSVYAGSAENDELTDKLRE